MDMMYKILDIFTGVSLYTVHYTVGDKKHFCHLHVGRSYLYFGVNGANRTIVTNWDFFYSDNESFSSTIFCVKYKSYVFNLISKLVLVRKSTEICYDIHESSHRSSALKSIDSLD